IGGNVGLSRRDLEGLNETAFNLLLNDYGPVDEQSCQTNQSNLTQNNNEPFPYHVPGTAMTLLFTDYRIEASIQSTFICLVHASATFFYEAIRSHSDVLIHKPELSWKVGLVTFEIINAGQDARGALRLSHGEAIVIGIAGFFGTHGFTRADFDVLWNGAGQIGKGSIGIRHVGTSNVLSAR
ncbi:MAG: hypothetical protein Q9214_005442, partial [Letrouitia sp. 1 TL-2023]